MVLLRPTDESQAYRPEPMPLESIYCDPYLRVINKPVGLVVHPAPGHWSGTLLNGLLALDELAHRLPRAGIVHRLDKDTSGLMLVARQRTSMDALVLALSQRKIKREYLALVHGVWPHRGVYGLNGAIGRDPKNRLRMAQLDATHPIGQTGFDPGRSARSNPSLHFIALSVGYWTHPSNTGSFVGCRLPIGRRRVVWWQTIGQHPPAGIARLASVVAAPHRCSTHVLADGPACRFYADHTTPEPGALIVIAGLTRNLVILRAVAESMPRHQTTHDGATTRDWTLRLARQGDIIPFCAACPNSPPWMGINVRSNQHSDVRC